MATYTTNYNLKKPATTEAYDIADFNGNADLIDAAIKAVDNKVNALPPVDQEISATSTNPISSKAVATFTKVLFEKGKVNKTVATSAWASDDTYEDFPYAAEIAVDDITADEYYAEVIFSPSDALSGNYAPVCNVEDGKIIIYAAAIPNETLTLPLIKITRIWVLNA